MENLTNLHTMLNHFRGATKVIEIDWQKAAKSVGLTQAELHTLWMIYFEGRASITTIATNGLWDRSTVMQVVKRLKEKGLVTVEKDDHDLRVSYVILTEEGKKRQSSTATAEFQFLNYINQIRQEDEEGFNKLMSIIIDFNRNYHGEEYVQWVEKTTKIYQEKFL
ncbi:MarR family transcriptional regulator [Anaerobacillus sp. CMMVII]|uniref:MarR family winged helix-turn-helix transcriptional regulator n=1 Tax=Anaerobacillus sp. CMMVII TaxID=2755588 RepID=UPI0021B733B4|nr:MarR family transcriptional regulator [Anaerobacillus sp. CMMVII]MCT8138739.1 MarR family transcriptional regulator [Anaerobacillus sp. CMMVII]